MTKTANRWRVKAAALLAASAVMAGCGGGSDDSTVKIADFAGEIFFTNLVAEEQGFFEDNGLEVERVAATTGPAALQLLVAGELDGVLLSSTLPIQTAASGQDIQLIGGTYNSSSYHIFASEESGLQPDAEFPEAIEDLEGKTVGLVALKGAGYLTLRALVESAGVDPETITFVAIGDPKSAVAQMRAGRIDAY
jgi:NitT/TauT family transport system substrate-binding protein